MQLLFKVDGGFHYFPDHEAEGAKAAGWVDGIPVREKLLAEKKRPPTSAPVANTRQPATMAAQSKPTTFTGRTPKGVPSILNDRAG